MTKKELAAHINALIGTIQHECNVNENTARTLVGMKLRKQFCNIIVDLTEQSPADAGNALGRSRQRIADAAAAK
jgi:hypothetical protein